MDMDTLRGLQISAVGWRRAARPQGGLHQLTGIIMIFMCERGIRPFFRRGSLGGGNGGTWSCSGQNDFSMSAGIGSMLSLGYPLFIPREEPAD